MGRAPVRGRLEKPDNGKGAVRWGDDYDKLQKCIHVSILDFIHFPQDRRCYRKITLCDVESGEQYTDLMELHVLELEDLKN